MGREHNHRAKIKSWVEAGSVPGGDLFFFFFLLRNRCLRSMKGPSVSMAAPPTQSLLSLSLRTLESGGLAWAPSIRRRLLVPRRAST